jgi:uncharacterized SAM-binding protein YcdF (DUF218 family)
MFWFLSKIVIFLSGIWFWVALLLLVAILIKNPKQKKKLLISTFVLFLFLLNSGIIGSILHVWEKKPIKVETINKPFEYGIVLGGFAGYDPENNTIEFNNSSDRLFSTIMLYKQGKIKRILISGGEGTLIKTGKTEAEVTADYLRSIAIPDSVIICEQFSKNTIENVLEIKKKIAGNGKNCLLITSASHMRRSLAIFHKQGMFPRAYSCDFRGSFTASDFLVFKSNALVDWDVLIHETVGYVVYWIMGYV